MNIYSQSYDCLKFKGLYHDTTSTNCKCYKKLRLAALMAVAAATMLAAEMAVVARMLAAIQW